MTTAINTFRASLGDPVPGSYRSTPPGQPTVTDLCPPGTVVHTSYSTQPFIVLKCSEHSWTDPNGIAWPYHSLSLTDVRNPSKSPKYWVNEVVAVDGRLCHLFANNSDEVTVDGTAPQEVLVSLGLDPTAPAPFTLPEPDNDPGTPPAKQRRRRPKAAARPVPVATEFTITFFLHPVAVTFWSTWPSFKGRCFFEFRAHTTLPWHRSTYRCCFARVVHVEAAGGPEAYARAYAKIAAKTAEERQLRIGSGRVAKTAQALRDRPPTLFDWADTHPDVFPPPVAEDAPPSPAEPAPVGARPLTAREKRILAAIETLAEACTDYSKPVPATIRRRKPADVAADALQLACGVSWTTRQRLLAAVLTLYDSPRGLLSNAQHCLRQVLRREIACAMKGNPALNPSRAISLTHGPLAIEPLATICADIDLPGVPRLAAATCDA